MYKKYLIAGILLLLSTGRVLSQDTSKNNKTNQVTSIHFTDPNPDSARIDRNLSKPHVEINFMNTSATGATSGTLGSPVNANSAFVIPFGWNKKKLAGK